MPILGERPVTSLDAKHPTLALILPKVDTKLEDVTSVGWWFNSFNTTLYPDDDGEIAVPLDTLSFVPAYWQVAAIVRGDKLYNPETMSYVFDGPVAGELIQRVPFEQLPETAASAVWYAALVDAYVTDIGMEQNVREWMQQAADAQARMEAEHLKQRKYSTYNNPRFQRVRNALRG
jgi:hypothetical protein